MKKPNVLLADDEKHIRILIGRVLTKMNCTVIAEAENGDESVSLFEQHKPNITFLDISMPLKTGIEALAEIKQIDPDALVIMLTSIDDSGSVEKCLDLGAANYIRKDTPLDQMKQLISETWGKSTKNKGA